jgi:predicted ferric reductase
MLMLMARIPALERGVGADRLARWHARGGRSILILILVHAVAATVAWSQVQQVDLFAATLQVLGFPGLAAATVGTALFCAVGVASIRAARKRLSYERWHLLHLGTYLAVGLSFAHELAGPNLAGYPMLQAYWSLLYTAAFGLVARYRLLDPLLRSARHRLRVVQVVQETPDVVSLVLRGRHLDDLQAEAGQFFRWRFLTPTTWRQANPFSLSAAPDGLTLRLTVKAVGAGTRAIHAVEPGTRVLAEGPYGAMTEHRRSGSGVLLLAGGVGITPMRALFETIEHSGGPLTLLYRVSNPEEVLFEHELRQIAALRKAELLIVSGRSSDSSKALSPENLRAWVPGVDQRDVFMCASPRFSEAARTALQAAGVPRRRIHQEEFVF